MEFIQKTAEQYAERYTDPEDELLALIAKQTSETHSAAHMLSGHVQGRFLSFLSSLLSPEYILEIGTFTGYSALCLAEGLTESGELHSIELRPEDVATARNNIAKSARAAQVFVHEGKAAEIIPALDFTWDLVFIDADKTGYIDYYNLVLPRLRSGGLIIADNVLFHGQVLEEPVAGKNALAIHAFNEHVKKDDTVNRIMLTVRDGLMLIRKK